MQGPKLRYKILPQTQDDPYCCRRVLVTRRASAVLAALMEAGVRFSTTVERSSIKVSTRLALKVLVSP
jgi:hypothetical protein